MFIKDEGYYFGIGAFETIALKEGIPQFLDLHYKRLLCALKFFGIDRELSEIERQVNKVLEDREVQKGRKALKITVSEKNIDISIRENGYQEEDYANGFLTEFSKIYRNETSPFTYHKTLNYGDCIIEKRNAKKKGIDEPIFLNTKGQIAEGATTNVFFIKDKKIFTPAMICGILPGIIREYLIRQYKIEEKIILPQDVKLYDEMFLTNSLLGIMPVRKLGNYTFSSMKYGKSLAKTFLKL